MIQFDNKNNEPPYLVFKDKYIESVNAKQKNIEAICISSYSSENKEVNARYVNLKIIDDKEFIFFSNYNSPKSIDFNSHNQITALIYWNNINVQIRMKAHIKKTSREFNQAYFTGRDEEKNALAISSEQSNVIDSYKAVQENYEISLKNSSLSECPKYWGGFSFIPYYFEFWEGHEKRLNKREAYEEQNGKWIHNFLQP
jgi:pyridoxamine 5'-phosphate oxidase